jgi:hypothetical protein
VIVGEFRDSPTEAGYALRRPASGGPRQPYRPHGWRAHVAELDGRLAVYLRVRDYRQFFGGRAVPMGGVATALHAAYLTRRATATSPNES